MNTGNNVIIDLQHKWSKSLNDKIRLDTLTNSFKNAKKYSPSVYQHFIKYKLLHGRIVYNRLLCKTGISETSNCLYSHNTETIEHVYIECINARHLWHLCYIAFKISDTEKLFGEEHNDYIKHNIVISTKDVIYQKRKNGEQMCLSDVKRSIF